MPSECREQVLNTSVRSPLSFFLPTEESGGQSYPLSGLYLFLCHSLFFFKQKHVWAHLSVLILFILKFTVHMTLQASLAFSLGEKCPECGQEEGIVA